MDYAPISIPSKGKNHEELMARRRTQSPNWSKRIIANALQTPESAQPSNACSAFTNRDAGVQRS